MGMKKPNEDIFKNVAITNKKYGTGLTDDQ